MSARRGGHPVSTGILILFGVGLVIRVLPYLLAALLLAGLIICLVALCRVAARRTTARQYRVVAALQAQLHEQQRLEAFLIPEDHEWIRRWS